MNLELQKTKELPDVKLEDLYEWIEGYKYFLCHSLTHNTHQEVERSLEYMSVITSLVQRVDHLEKREAQLELIILDLNEQLTKRLETSHLTIDL